jgi:phosphopantetheinyl transferase
VDLSAGAALLDIYPRLSARQARALVRAARSYQDTLWIADSDRRLAWLRLVTATETVAQLSGSGPAAQTLSTAHPEIAQRLNNADDPELTHLVTEKLVAQSRVTANFLAFLKCPKRPVGGPHRATESAGTI